MGHSLFMLIKGSVLMCAGFYAGEVSAVYSGLAALIISPLFVILENV